jgi:hypothetical protein
MRRRAFASKRAVLRRPGVVDRAPFHGALAQPPRRQPTRRRALRTGAFARARGRGQRKDARASPTASRAWSRSTASRPRAHPRGELHQQGRRGDGRAHGAARRRQGAAKALWLSTFHSVRRALLSRGVQDALQRERQDRFSIFDQADCGGPGARDHRLRRAKGKGGERKLDLWSVQRRISLWKNKMILGADQIKDAVEYDEVARHAYPHYEAALRSMRAFDFDDLVVASRCLCSRRARRDARALVASAFGSSSIDEFQDTNAIQLELVKLLVERAAKRDASWATTTSPSTDGAAPRSSNILDVREAPSAARRSSSS